MLVDVDENSEYSCEVRTRVYEKYCKIMKIYNILWRK